MKEKLRHLFFDKPDNILILILNILINVSWVFLLGLFIDKSFKNTLIIVVIWTICLFMGEAKHYKSPLKCFLMQVLLFSSIFMSIYINIYVACVFTIYTKYLLSGHADIEDTESEIDDKPSFIDLTLWKPKNADSIYQPLIDYLKYNALTDEYLEAEKLLKEKVGTEMFLIYKRKFFDGFTYEKIINELNVTNPKIKEALDKCYYFLIGRLKI